MLDPSFVDGLRFGSRGRLAYHGDRLDFTAIDGSEHSCVVEVEALRNFLHVLLLNDALPTPVGGLGPGGFVIESAAMLTAHLDGRLERRSPPFGQLEDFAARATARVRAGRPRP